MTRINTSSNKNHDDDYVNVTGDTMTGALTITPTTGTTALTSNLNFVLKSGKKLIFDGA